MNLTKHCGYLKREDFEQYTKEQLVDILVKLVTMKFEKTSQWYPQEYFLNIDTVADILRMREV